MSKSTQKTKLIESCLAKVELNIKTYSDNLELLKESLLSETKSSAGDKHETGRAMVQLEMEKLSSQIEQYVQMKRTLDKIIKSHSTENIALGSIIFTSQFNYFLSVSLGEMKLDESSIYCVTVQSPIGKALLGKKVGDQIEFNQKSMSVLEVI